MMSKSSLCKNIFVWGLGFKLHSWNNQTRVLAIYLSWYWQVSSTNHKAIKMGFEVKRRFLLGFLVMFLACTLFVTGRIHFVYLCFSLISVYIYIVWHVYIYRLLKSQSDFAQKIWSMNIHQEFLFFLSDNISRLNNLHNLLECVAKFVALLVETKPFLEGCSKWSLLFMF